MLRIKRGDTFRTEAVLTFAGAPQPLAGWTIRSQVRRGSKPVADLTVEIVDSVNGRYQLFAAEGTSEWPLGTLRSDIEYTMPNGQIASTETFEIDVIEDVTR